MPSRRLIGSKQRAEILCLSIENNLRDIMEAFNTSIKLCFLGNIEADFTKYYLIYIGSTFAITAAPARPQRYTVSGCNISFINISVE